MSWTRTLRSLALSTTALLGCGVTVGDSLDSTITVVNDSDVVIDAILVAELSDPEWGPNLVPEALFPDEAVTVLVDCGVYDVLVVDEFGVECELLELDLCFDDSEWWISNADLNLCSF